MSLARSFWFRLAVITAGALALRVAYVLILGKDVGGAGDYAFYHAVANLLAEGRGYIDPFGYVADGTAEPTALHPPLWPLMLSLSSLAGATGEVAHKLVGCFVGSGVVFALGALARRLGGDRMGLLAAAVAATYPVLITADGSLMSEALYGLLVALALIVVHELLERPRPLPAALLGVLVGLAGLTRSEALLLLPLLAAPAVFMSAPGWRLRAALLGIACAGTVLVIAPWTAYNLSRFERPVLVSTNDGTLLAGANCPESYSGPTMGGWRFDCISRTRPGEDDSERSARWRREGLEYAVEHAERLPLVVPVRVLRSWELYQPLEQVQYAEGRHRDVVRVGVVWYFALLPLAVLGFLALRRRKPVLWLLAPVALVIVTSALGYGVPRLRHAAELPLVIFAAAGIERLYERRSSRRSPAATSRPASAIAGSVTPGSSQSQSRPA